MNLRTRVLKGHALTSEEMSQLYLEVEHAASGTTFSHMSTQKTQDGLTSYQVLAGQVSRIGTKMNILDLGCGSGEILPLLDPSLVTSYHGVDISRKALSRASGTNSAIEAEFTLASAVDLPFKPSSFGCVISHMFLHMCSDLEGAMRSAYGLLKSGSPFISVIRKYGDARDILNQLRPLVRDFIQDHYPEFRFRPKSPLINDFTLFYDICQNAGFSNVKVNTFYLYQTQSKYLVTENILEMFPACLLDKQRKSQLRTELNSYLENLRDDEIAFPMRTIVARK